MTTCPGAPVSSINIAHKIGGMAIIQRLRARSETELHPVWDWLNDASFSTTTVRWDRESGTVTIPIANYSDNPNLPSRQPLRRSFLSESFLRPWFRATLTVRAVRAMRPEPAQLIEPGILEGVDWIPDRRVVRISSINGDASFDLEVDGFDVEFAATDEIDHWRKHRYGRFWKWESHGPALDQELGKN